MDTPVILEPEISVLMPAFNAEKYISEAINSILNQTFTNFELIIIDDGSKDKTLNVINSFQDKRIKVYSNITNLGVLFTRNKLIELANSPIVAWMDADDIAFPERLEKQYSFLKQNQEISLICSWITLTKENGEIICVQDRLNKHMYYDLLFKCVIANPTVMCRKEALLKLGGFKYKYAEDYEMWSRFSKVNKIFKLDEPLVLYRISENSLSHNIHKNECIIAAEEIVLTNITNIIGETSIKKEILDCFMDNFSSIKKMNSIHDYINCLRLLNKINSNFLKLENPNRNRKNIKEAAFLKRLLIYNNLKDKLSLFQKGYLLLFSNSWKLLIYLSKQNLKSVLK